MKTLFVTLGTIALLIGGLTGDALAADRPSRIPAFPGHVAPSVPAGKTQVGLDEDDDNQGRSTLLKAALIPASGGIATSVTSAQLEINNAAGVTLRIRGLTGSSGPIT